MIACVRFILRSIYRDLLSILVINKRCRMQYGLLCNMDYSIETKEIPIIVYC